MIKKILMLLMIVSMIQIVNAEEPNYYDGNWDTYYSNYTKSISDIVNFRVTELTWEEYINETPPIYHIIVGETEDYYCCYQGNKECRIYHNGTCKEYLYVGNCYLNESVCLNNKTHIPKEEFERLKSFSRFSEVYYEEAIYWNNLTEELNYIEECNWWCKTLKLYSKILHIFGINILV